jgi:hypothetical protein
VFSRSPDEVAYELSNSAWHANWIAQNDAPAIALHRREIGIFILRVMESARYFFAEGNGLLWRFVQPIGMSPSLGNRNFYPFSASKPKPDDGDHFSFLSLR